MNETNNQGKTMTQSGETNPPTSGTGVLGNTKQLAVVFSILGAIWMVDFAVIGAPIYFLIGSVYLGAGTIMMVKFVSYDWDGAEPPRKKYSRLSRWWWAFVLWCALDAQSPVLNRWGLRHIEKGGRS